ncbi:MAG TPA: response regulator, partial [Burkholderiaceae bacterium]
GESGEVFAAEARALRPGLRIVFATGSGNVPDMSGEGFSPVMLRKPFNLDALAAALARAR